jgi:hypothetical protein
MMTTKIMILYKKWIVEVGSSCKTPDFVRIFPVCISAGARNIPAEIFRGIPQPPQANIGIVPLIRL